MNKLFKVWYTSSVKDELIEIGILLASCTRQKVLLFNLSESNFRYSCRLKHYFYFVIMVNKKDYQRIQDLRPCDLYTFWVPASYIYYPFHHLVKYCGGKDVALMDTSSHFEGAYQFAIFINLRFTLIKCLMIQPIFSKTFPSPSKASFYQLNRRQSNAISMEQVMVNCRNLKRYSNIIF